uniref:Uncharacterized protein n=1 Tax=Anopheles farauti TaxID=69004 RepID=A0A182QAN5_9DIPT
MSSTSLRVPPVGVAVVEDLLLDGDRGGGGGDRTRRTRAMMMVVSVGFLRRRRIDGPIGVRVGVRVVQRLKVMVVVVVVVVIGFRLFVRIATGGSTAVVVLPPSGDPYDECLEWVDLASSSSSPSASLTASSASSWAGWEGTDAPVAAATAAAAAAAIAAANRCCTDDTPSGGCNTHTPLMMASAESGSAAVVGTFLPLLSVAAAAAAAAAATTPPFLSGLSACQSGLTHCGAAGLRRLILDIACKLASDDDRDAFRSSSSPPAGPPRLALPLPSIDSESLTCPLPASSASFSASSSDDGIDRSSPLICSLMLLLRAARSASLPGMKPRPMSAARLAVVGAAVAAKRIGKRHATEPEPLLLDLHQPLAEQHAELHRIERCAGLVLARRDRLRGLTVRDLLLQAHPVVVEPVGDGARRQAQLARQELDRLHVRNSDVSLLEVSLLLSCPPGPVDRRRLLASRRSFFSTCSRSTLLASLSQSCMRMNGSRPLMLSMCQGFGFESSSETEPCDRPSTASPKIFCPMLFASSASLIFVVITCVSRSCVRAAIS